jgi:Domain of unknown function (DUF1844)
MSEKPNEPKIVVDEDWKAQVAKEREQLKQQTRNEEPAAGEKLPPASLQILITTYATQALVSMGYIPDPMTKEPSVNRSLAKHFIDMLSVIEEKTKGNLETEESTLLTETLHQLRMAFVASRSNSPAEGPAKPKSTIELP